MIDFSDKGLFNKETQNNIKWCDFTSIMCNWERLRKIAVIEKEGIYVLFVDADDFEVKTCLFSLQSLGSQNANGTFSETKTAISENNPQKKMANVVFMTSDGSSVTTGLKIGLNKLVKHKIPWVGFVWVISYRLELAFKDASSKLTKPIAT